jgi:HEAT repeat protein
MNAQLRLVLAYSLVVVACADDEKGAHRANAEVGASAAGATPAEEGAARASEAPRAELLPAAQAPPTPESGARVDAVLSHELDGDGVDALVRAVHEDGDARGREAAVVLLGASDDPRALDALIAATEDAEPRVVIAAIAQLRWSDDRLAEDAIRRLADSPEPEIAAAAREATE